MPELPEIEIAVRRIEAAVAGIKIESAMAPGMNTMKTFDPPLHSLAGRELESAHRRGKLIMLGFGEHTLLMHLMQGGRIQLHDKRASMRDRTARVLLRLIDGRELRLREFGTQQRAWAKLLVSGAVAQDEDFAKLGPEAYPPPDHDTWAALIDGPHHLHPLLRDQRTIAGIGRSWVDEILWEAELSPFRKGSDLDGAEVARLRVATEEVLGGALAHYEEVIGPSLPDKLPMPLKVHRRQGEPCPRCATTLEAVHFKDYVMTYCPAEQTGGRVLKDRRLSRLLK
ncbi:MAG: DNA-formamidopyrimidine glycosylase [Thermoleophilaceae bacterium]|nr:DNA-formamidopyrimidine glycosylase [Thermoleophilaceae bacterium]